MNLAKVALFSLSVFALTAPCADADLGQTINLARSDKDQPGDNSFVLTEASNGQRYSMQNLKNGLMGYLPSVFSRMSPQTDDPTIRNVAMKVNGNEIAFTFQKQTLFFWSSVEIGGTTTLENASCPDSSQTGFQIILNTSGSTSSQAQGYVNGARILICATEFTDQDGHHLAIAMERDLYAGPQYQSWIGYLMGDFLRSFGRALEKSLK